MDFSDSDEDSAVDRLISQAKDHIVLEQLSAINCSSFTDEDSVLPSHLESRFSRLKSFPASTASFRHNTSIPETKSTTPGHVSPPLQNRESKPKPRRVSVSNSSDSSPEPPKRNSDEKKHRSAKSKSRLEWFSSSSLGSCNSLRDDSPSPPKKAGFCLWCSPKKEKKSGGGSSSLRKSKDNAKVNGHGLNFSDDDEILAGLGSFSKKEQSRILKKAMKEEEKISREAEKIVQWAKQQSARMNVTGIDPDEELSD